MSATETAKRRERVAAILDRDGYPVDGSDLAREIARAVRDETRKWRSIGTAERDALSGEVALLVLEMRDRGRDPLADREWHERNGYLRMRVRSMIRDSREWRDSLDGVTVRDQRKGRKGTRRAILADSRVAEVAAHHRDYATLTPAEQAARYRDEQRDERPAPVVSLDALTDATTGDPVGVLAHGLAREAERKGDPPAALAEHSPLLADALTDAVAQLLAERNMGVTDAARANIHAALIHASGERMAAIAADLRIGVRSAERRVSAGRTALRTVVSASELARLRRDAATALDLVPPHDGPAWGEDAARVRSAAGQVESCKREARTRYMGRPSAEPSVVVPVRAAERGSGRAVVAYMRAVENAALAGARLTSAASVSVAALPARRVYPVPAGTWAAPLAGEYGGSYPAGLRPSPGAAAGVPTRITGKRGQPVALTDEQRKRAAKRRHAANMRAHDERMAGYRAARYW